MLVEARPRRVPAHLRLLVGKSEIKASLHTHAAIARDRHRAAAADAEWVRLEAAAQPAAATDSAPPALTQRQVTAIASEVYRLIGEELAKDPGDPAFWARKLSEDAPDTPESAALNQGGDQHLLPLHRLLTIWHRTSLNRFKSYNETRWGCVPVTLALSGAVLPATLSMLRARLMGSGCHRLPFMTVMSPEAAPPRIRAMTHQAPYNALAACGRSEA